MALGKQRDQQDLSTPEKFSVKSLAVAIICTVIIFALFIFPFSWEEGKNEEEEEEKEIVVETQRIRKPDGHYILIEKVSGAVSGEGINHDPMCDACVEMRDSHNVRIVHEEMDDACFVIVDENK